MAILAVSGGPPEHFINYACDALTPKTGGIRPPQGM